MTLSEELSWRGFVNQTTFGDIKALDKPLTFYWGVDPSSDSMTIGNLALAMMVRHFIDHGHKAILLVGGATGMIGDPDGKNEERDLKSLEEIQKNKDGIAAQYRRIFAGQDFEIVDNYDWFKGLGYLDFLREVGKHFSMTQLLDREFVQSRIGKDGKGISYAEFSYSLIQGYDFLHLFRKKGATLQVAGADQWGNSIAGVELIRKLEGKTAHIWTGPLVINTSTGMKFGKTEGGAVWIDPNKTSVFDFYQFWLNVDDAGAPQYLKFYTLLSQEEIKHLEQETKQSPKNRAAQKKLAYEVTKIVHGKAQADAAKQATEQLNGADTAINNDMIPILSVGQSDELNIIKVLVDAKLATGQSDAKRLVSQGGVRFKDLKITDQFEPIRGEGLLQVGKRRFLRIQRKSD
ncbi:MAG TPA: tyrosine--tRNA ligase [Patescibacteria group bacterium]|jgi:tyrosyl-tRNA synthetase|nr:tyrosine--tRNA ligase [Patescibacteria group bacterium]